MLYTCEKCNYVTISKYNFTRHQRRRLPCVVDKTYHLSSYNKVSKTAPNVDPIAPNVDPNAPNVDPKNMYKCEKCLKYFSYKFSLNRHINNNRCKEVQHLLQCPVCKIVFSDRSAKSRHINKGKCVSLVTTKNDSSVSIFKNNQATCSKKNNVKLTNTTTTNNVYINGNVNNNITNININPFGMEDISHLLNAKSKESLELVYSWMKKSVNGLLHCCSYIYFNSDYSW